MRDGFTLFVRKLSLGAERQKAGYKINACVHVYTHVYSSVSKISHEQVRGRIIMKL